MEEDNSAVRYTFYGYFSASIYSHRPGVLTNMTVDEVEAAKADRATDTNTRFYTEVPHRLSVSF